MKLHRNILIEKACSNDITRPVLNHAYLEMPDGKPSRLIATDGRIAAIVPVLTDREMDVDGYVSPKALQAARRVDKRAESVSLTLNGNICLPDGQTFCRPDLGKFPNVDGVIPKGKTTHAIHLDPVLLLAVAQAIGSERGVTLEFSGERYALRVRPVNNPRARDAKGQFAKFAPACPDAIGLIMPIRVEA